MTSDPQGRSPWLMAAIGAVCLIAGAAVTYVVVARRSAPDETPATSAASISMPTGSGAASPTAPGQPLPDVTIAVPADALSFAGIVTQPAASGMVNAQILLAGVVEPNSVRQVLVTAPASGRVVSVTADPGNKVERGQPLAQVESPDLSLAQSQALAAKSVLAAAQQEVQKMEKLAGVGAVSRQELDRVRTEQTTRQAEADAARTRLIALGMSPDQIVAFLAGGTPSAITTVIAPNPGTIVERQITQSQMVDAGTRIFVIADLSSVWVAGDLPERELARVRIGSTAVVTTPDRPESYLTGTVVFIDPQVNLTTHASRIRVEVPNLQPELQTGTLAAIEIKDAAFVAATLVPKEAVQEVGDRRVVYLPVPGQEGTYIERDVQLGPPSGEQVSILAGVKAGDPVVVRGSAFLLGERQRLGLRK